MNLTWSEDEEAFRRKAREWLHANVPKEGWVGSSLAELESVLAFERLMFADGWAVVSWPVEYGGRNASLWEWLIFEEEYFRAGGPHRVTQNGIFLLAPSIFEYGTKTQRDWILPRMAAGIDVWAQGWSEPGAGSDLAAISSRATRSEARGGWIVNGQKTWTTRGAIATHIFGLFRSDPRSHRHHGLTYLLVPVGAPGVTIRPFERLDGTAEFADVYFEDVFVPDAWVLGEPGQGWEIAMATTGSERGLTLRSPGRFMATWNRLASAAIRSGMDAVEKDRLVRSWIDVRAYELLTLESVTKMAEGESVGAESSINKVHWSETDLRMYELSMDIEGSNAQIDSEWSRGFQFALAGPIYAGTNDIQRNIIAQRLLKLPRA